MENSSKKWRKKVPITTIDASLDKYSQDKRILAKLQEDKEWLAKVGMPDLYYEEQAKIQAENGKRVLAKVAEAKKMYDAGEFPPFVYDDTAPGPETFDTYTNVLLNTEKQLVAHEPMPEYNAPKQEEK